MEYLTENWLRFDRNRLSFRCRMYYVPQGIPNYHTNDSATLPTTFSLYIWLWICILNRSQRTTTAIRIYYYCYYWEKSIWHINKFFCLLMCHLVESIPNYIPDFFFFFLFSNTNRVMQLIAKTIYFQIINDASWLHFCVIV